MTEETTALATAPEYDVSKYQKQDLGEDQASAIAGGGFMSRLQLMTSRSKKCESGEFPINHYALVDGSTHIDVGETVDIIPFCWRPLAMDTSGEDSVFCYEPNFDENNNPTGEYLRIMEKSKTPNSGCMYGPQFLVWVASRKKFCTFFLGSTSARREAANLIARLGQPTTLSAKQITTKKFSWYICNILPCSTPVDGPDPSVVGTLAEEFNNPPKGLEVVEEDEEERER